jgi:hypothetical protein
MDLAVHQVLGDEQADCQQEKIDLIRKMWGHSSAERRY